MSEWLTTGQMIDRLKVGEEALCSQGIMHIRKNENGEIVHLDHPQGTVILNKGILTAKWRILPKYAKGLEAMEALKEGKCKYVLLHLDDDVKIAFTNYNSCPDEVTLKDLFEGKWQIIE